MDTRSIAAKQPHHPRRGSLTSRRGAAGLVALLPLALLLLSPSLGAQSRPGTGTAASAAASLAVGTGPRLAFVGLENSEGDPRLDYLGPVIEGLLLYDLDQGRVEVSDRKALGKILAEQDFQTSGLTEAAGAARLGRLTNARWLLWGSYGVIDAEVVLNLVLADVETGLQSSFRERGAGEHTVHYAAEKLIRVLTGRQILLADAANNRSLVSLRDQTTGSLHLHSALEGGKIFIDGEFVGFTQGQERQALVFDRLPPGRHTVRVELNRDFGSLQGQPLAFAPWEETFEVRPGRPTALIDRTRHFTDAFRQTQTLMYRTRSVYTNRPELFQARDQARFIDSRGRTVEVELEAGPPTGGRLPIALRHRIDGIAQAAQTLSPPTPAESTGRNTLKLSVPGLLQGEVSLYQSGNTWYLRWEVLRSDLDEEALRP